MFSQNVRFVISGIATITDYSFIRRERNQPSLLFKEPNQQTKQRFRETRDLLRGLRCHRSEHSEKAGD